MTRSRHSFTVTQSSAATNARNFRSFLLMQQFAAQEIGARISQARNERGLTQEQLAEIAPFSKRSLQDYEAGVTIPYKHLRDLARLLNRPEEWFLYGDQEQPSEGSSVDRLEAKLESVLEAVEDLRAELREGGQVPPAAESRHR